MGFELPVGFVIDSNLNMPVPEGNQVAAVFNTLSPSVLNSAGFPLLENVLTVGSQNHEEVTVPDVLQIRETLFFTSGSFPLLPCDAVSPAFKPYAKNLLCAFRTSPVLRQFAESREQSARTDLLMPHCISVRKTERR